MREALAARSGRDFVVTGPSILAAAGTHCWTATRGTMRFVLGHPALMLMLVLVGTGLGGVAINALLWQTSRHPAPILGAGNQSRAAPVLPPLPPARPAPAPPPSAAPISAAPAPPSVAVPATIPAAPAKTTPGRDPIGDMIRTKEIGVGAAKSDPTKIAAAQRALSKLGYGPLKADGMPGAGTRQAIERFERDRGLTVTGELNAKTSKELSLRAGIAIE